MALELPKLGGGSFQTRLWRALKWLEENAGGPKRAGPSVKSGVVNLAGGSTNVVFTTPFASVPHVVTSQLNSVHAVTVNGFTLRGHGAVAWIATDAGNI